MKERAQEILRSILSEEPMPTGDLADRIRRRVEQLAASSSNCRHAVRSASHPISVIVPDTNALLEVMRPQPSARVLKWMQAEPLAPLFTTAIRAHTPAQSGAPRPEASSTTPRMISRKAAS